jgi:DNA polymerase I-like protein with 3'-5' exonuclease and polymerase domains/uracil-DNA glycosylase
MIVGEAPGINEERERAPFVGASGLELNRMLQEAGLFRSECFVTNVARERPTNNDIDHFIDRRKKRPSPFHTKLNDAWVTIEILEGLALLRKEIELCQPTVIIAVGNLALWALTGHWGILSWRGSSLGISPSFGNGSLSSAPTIIPTIHPAAILRQWPLRPWAVTDLRRATKLVRSGPQPLPEWNFLIRPSFEEAHEWLARLYVRLHHSDATRIAVDIETRRGHIACVGFATSRTEALCVPLMCVERPEGYWSLHEEAALTRLMCRVLTHPNARLIGQNFIYDAQYFHRAWGLVLPCWWDTMLSHHVCFPDVKKALDFLSSIYCDYHLYWKEDGKEWVATMDENQLWTYNCTDCVRTFEVAEKEAKTIEAFGLEQQHAFQHRMFPAVLRSMNRGVCIDLKMRDELRQELEQGVADREAWLAKICGHRLNPASSPQMRAFFYADMGLRPIIDRETGQPTCDDEALVALASREPIVRPIVDCIRELRTIRTILANVITAKLDIDSRMRCSYNIAGTVSFRFSSSENAFGSGTNLENIPAGKGGLTSKGIKKGNFAIPNLRKMFIPDPGFEMFDTDLEGADIRVVCWEADCKEMKSIFAAGEAVYVAAAREFYHDPSITKKHPRYPAYKAICHATNYLGKAPTVARSVGLLVHEVEQVQRWYFGKFPEIKRWQDRFVEEFLQTSMVQNIFGFKRRFLDRLDGQSILNEAINWVPQSTVALTINHIYLMLHEQYPEVEVLLQTHDSLTGQYLVERREEALAAIRLCSGSVVLPYADPLIIPVATTTSAVSWGDCA